MVDADVDAAEHGPAALEMLARLAVAILRGGKEAPAAVISVLRSRRRFWDRILGLEKGEAVPRRATAN